MTPPEAAKAAPPRGGAASGLAEPAPRRPLGWGGGLLRVVLTGLLLASATGFATLSAWQWQRLAWKEALLERIARQQAAAPQPLAAPAAWAGISRDNDEYRPVTLRGHLEPQREIRVLASTELGRGHWVMVPLRLTQGSHDISPDGARVWLNRGFVDEAHTEPATRPAPTGEINVTGLLRFSESGQWLWQRNDPASGRWVGRDLAEMSRAARISAAPFFIDVAEGGERLATAPATAPADAGGAPPATVPDATAPNAGFPRGGLTVLRFSNNHLVYALTWLALAAGTLVAAALLWRLAPARSAA